MRSSFSAAVRIKAFLRVTVEALGHEFAGRTDSADFWVTLPSQNLTAKMPGSRLLPPASLAIAAPKDFWGNRIAFPDSTPSVIVEGVAVHGEVDYEPGQIDADPDDAVEQAIWEFGDEFSRWYKIAANWLELWTNQVLEHRGYQSGLTGKLILAGLEHDEPFVYSDESHMQGVHGSRDGATPESFARIPAGIGVIRAAFAKASQQISAPSEWIALYNARRTSDNRFAVIEAATAAEISLAQAAERHLSKLGPAGADWFMRRANGVSALAQMLKSLDGSPDAVSLAERIAAPRNRAVHRGLSPTEHEVMASIEAAYQILKIYSPLPGWE